MPHVYNTQNMLWGLPMKSRWPEYLQSSQSEDSNTRSVVFPNSNLELYKLPENFWGKRNLQGSTMLALRNKFTGLRFNQYNDTENQKALVLTSETRSKEQFSLTYNFIIT